MNNVPLETVFPVVSTLLNPEFMGAKPTELAHHLRQQPSLWQETPYLLELAEIELLAYTLQLGPPPVPEKVESWQIRPGVELLEATWSDLPELMRGVQVQPLKKDSMVLLTPATGDQAATVTTPENGALLALKIIVEGLDPLELARLHKLPVEDIHNLLDSAVERGLALRPTSKICRPANFAPPLFEEEKFLRSTTFTLQWHITQSCDLHCRHCYDRSWKDNVSVDQGRIILDQLAEFCQENNVRGLVSFTGGNPLLHPQFHRLYNEACNRGLRTAILGNPADRAQLEAIINIQQPYFYQLSLEGLPEHNDYIRGIGHFDRVMTCLELLKELGIFSMIMLTLTRANKEEVLPLAQLLKNKTDLFTFNRLAMVGEGADLSSVPTKDYKKFLSAYRDAAQSNPILGLKDNLFNLLKWEEGVLMSGGCTGFGCGAAFNFVSILPDGEVHACRKLPSRIGNIFRENFSQIYGGEIARKYRAGSSGCRDCEIRAVCGGCPAVSSGFSLDISTDIDPYCFKV